MQFKNYNAIETVLNLIQTQQAEIEKKDKRLNRQFKLLQKKDKEIKEREKAIDIVNKEKGNLLTDKKKKDKIIDLMAEEFVSKTLMYSDMTKEEVKEYFENKAEE